MSIDAVKPRSATLQPTLSELLHTFDNKTGTLRYAEGKELHIKRGFSLSGLRVKMGDKAALQERKAQRAAAAEHIKLAIDAQYGKGMGEAVFAEFDKMQYDLSSGVRHVELRKMAEFAEELKDKAAGIAVNAAERRLGGDRLLPWIGEDLCKSHNITLDTSSMPALQIKMAQAVLDLGDNSKREEFTAAAEGVFKAEAPSYQAFRMAQDQAMLSLQLSESYSEAPTEDKKKEMEAKLNELLQDPRARGIIAVKELSPEEAVRDANFLLSYGMTQEEAVTSLEGSNVHKAAGELREQDSSNDKLLDDLKGQMTPRNLGNHMKAMLKDPSCRAAIRKYGLKPAEFAALRFYADAGAYTDVQAALRGGSDAAKKFVGPLADACRSGLAKLPPLDPKTKLVYRGTPVFGHSVGEVYTDPAFVSTSTKEEIGRNFSDGKFLIKLQLDHPSMASGRDVSVLLGEANLKEAEVLFPPGTKFKVTGMQTEQPKNDKGGNAGTLTVFTVIPQ